MKPLPSLFASPCCGAFNGCCRCWVLGALGGGLPDFMRYGRVVCGRLRARHRDFRTGAWASPGAATLGAHAAREDGARPYATWLPPWGRDLVTVDLLIRRA